MPTPDPASPTPATGAASFGGGLPRGRLLIIFAGLLLAILISALDQTVVATALPTIAGDLHGLRQLSWVITAYLLAETVVIPIYGKLGDLFGRKNLFLFSIALFLVGSVLSGLSQSMVDLIAFRAVQGVGAGGLMIGAQAIIGEIVSARERGRYMSVMVPMIGVATVIGPLLGGFLTQHASWRWIFYINLPIGALALVVVGLGLRLPRRPRRPVIDYWGTALLAGAVTCIVLLTSLGGTTYPWGSAPIAVFAGAAAVLLGGWLWVERRVPEPVLPLRLFRNPIFAVCVGLAFSAGFAMFGAVNYLPTFLQLVGGASATNSGILLLPLVAGLMVASVVTGQLIARTGRYKVFPILGTGATGAGLYLLSTMGPTTTSATSSAYMVVLGMGLGLIMPVLTLVVQNAVPFDDLGVATSGVNFFRQIAGAIGVALAGTIFATRLSHELATQLPPALAHQAAAHASGITPAALHQLPPALRTGFIVSFSHAVTAIFIAFLPLAVAAFVLAWFLREKPLATRAHVARAEDAATSAEPAPAAAAAGEEGWVPVPTDDPREPAGSGVADGPPAG